MAKVYITTDTGGNRVLTSASGKSTSSPYTNNAGSNPKAQVVDTTRSSTPTVVRTVTQAAAPAPSYSGGGGGPDSILDKIKSLLEEQKAQADAYYKTLYEQQLADNKTAFEKNRNQINLNRERGDRYIRNMYGTNPNSGVGISNRVRNNQNWISNLASNRQSYTNNDATAQANYNLNRANAASTLAQGWYNYVLPVYTNRQQNQDNYEYRKYLAGLSL